MIFKTAVHVVPMSLLFLKSACPCSFCTNTKNGNKYLAWAFIEAANFAIRYNDTVKRYYQKKLAKTKVVIARKTVAHKLARACFYVLRDQVDFDVNKAFGYSK